jgi:predicted nuclease of predicted toxin-antitoxin system
MRFLVDQCLSVELAEALADAGHDVTHLRELGMQRARDPEVLELARAEERVLLSADTDFAALLARTAARSPSVVLFRRLTGRHPHAQAVVLLGNLSQISAALDQGSVVVIEETRLRIRRLPIID